MKKKKTRHPTEKKCRKPTPTPPTISCGKRDREVLEHLSNLGKEAFNVKQYSREKKIPRSSVYEILNRLERKSLVIRKPFDNQITRQGKLYIEKTINIKNRGVGSSRWGCREKDKLSTHYIKFTLPIENRKDFRIEKLEKLNHKGFKENKLPNLHQIIINFEDATIVINPKQVIINLIEFIGDEVDDSDIKSLTRAVSYAEELIKVGIVTEGVMVEESHWARMESVLSNFIYDKVDKKYSLTLDNGSKFFIDCSGGGIEDETDDKVVRQRVDKLLNQVVANDIDLTDINKIKESLGFITKLESSRLMDKIEENKLARLKLETGEVSIEKINLIQEYIC